MGGSPKVVHTLGGGLAKGVLGVYKGGGWVKEGSKSAYVICTQPLIENACRDLLRPLRSLVSPSSLPSSTVSLACDGTPSPSTDYQPFSTP